MARLIQLLLVVTLTAAVWSAPYVYDSDSSSSSSSSEELHRWVRSPHHDGTDHDHSDEKTDQDHEHPVLTGDAQKALGHGATSTQARPARDTPDAHKHKESDESSQEKDDDETSPSQQAKNHYECMTGEGIRIACPGRETRDTKTRPGDKQQPNNPSLNLDDVPGPILLQGQPIPSGIRKSSSQEDKSSSQENKSSQEQTKTITKRESPPAPGYPEQPSNTKHGNPLTQPHLDPTPPPGYKPKYNKRDTTAVKQEPLSPLTSAENHHHHHDEGHQSNEQVPQTTQGKPKRDTEQQQELGGPLKSHEPVHIKTEDGHDGVVSLPPRPGPQAQHKRDTSDPKLDGPHKPVQTIHGQTQDGKEQAAVLPTRPQNKQKRETTSESHSTGPHAGTQTITGETDNGQVAAAVLPARPGGPGGPQPKQKRDTADHSQHQPQIQPVRPAEHPGVANPKAQPVPAIHTGPHTQHKREAEKNEQDKNEKPATLNKEAKSDEDEKKEEHKHKRDTYKLDPKDSGHESPLHTQPQSGEDKLSPPTHESEYDRHVRATVKDEEKDSSKTAESHSSESHPVESDEKKSESSEKKKDA